MARRSTRHEPAWAVGNGRGMDGRHGAIRIFLGCRPRHGVRRAARRAVVPSQAPATVSIAESSAYTFPAVYALHPAATSTCRAPFPGACLAVERKERRCVRRPGASPPPFVRSARSRDRAAGIGDGWLRGRAVVPSQAPATVSIAESSAYTFPAVYPIQPADASTCRASFAGACLAVGPEGGAGASAGQGRRLHRSCGPGAHEIARRGSVTGWLRGRSGGMGASLEKRGWPPAASHPCARPSASPPSGTVPARWIGCPPGRRISRLPCNKIDEDPKIERYPRDSAMSE
jgi:hypothetical protein